MKDRMYSNEMLYKKRFNIKIYGFLIFVLLTLVVYLLFFTEKYEVLGTKGYISCNDTCKVSIITGVDDYVILEKAEKIYIGEEEIDIKKVNVSNVNTDWDAYESYRTVELELDSKVSYNDEIVPLNILCNKKTLINKINPFKKGG